MSDYTDYNALIERTLAEYRQKHNSRPCRNRLALGCAVIVLLVAALVLVAAAGLTVFEDGSFIFFNLSGCLPGGICNL